MNPNVTQALIVFLFAKGEPVKKEQVQKYLGLTDEAFSSAITAAAAFLEQGGLTLVDDGKEIELRTSSAVKELVEKIRKDEFSKDIGKAGIETLAIVLYRGPASRSEIDYIRGVNSSHILRSLAMRGLLRRVPHPKDDRSFMYEPTTELLAHFGISSVQELPEYAEVTAELSQLEAASHEAETAVEKNEVSNS